MYLNLLSQHGAEDARILHNSAVNIQPPRPPGLNLQKRLAREVLAQPSKQLVELGSMYVCEEGQLADFAEEFELLRSLGADVRWARREEVRQMRRGWPPPLTCLCAPTLPSNHTSAE
jgi:hypothetical protein